jgi:flagellar protein FliS
MNCKAGIQAYHKTNITTADPKKLVLMCYEGAIESLKIGRQKLIEKDFEGKGKSLEKAQNFINELQFSLNYEKGGSIARNLYSLYNYILRRIMHADLNRDTEAIDEVIGILNGLKSAWEEIFRNKEKKVQPEAVQFDKERRPQAENYTPF